MDAIGARIRRTLETACDGLGNLGLTLEGSCIRAFDLIVSASTRTLGHFLW